MISDSELLPATASPLAWRWTSEQHGQFSTDELAAIQALSPSAAESLHARLMALDLAFVEVGSAQSQAEDVRTTLASVFRGVDSLLLSWADDTAVCVATEVFLSRWPDFCYPASDDVFIAAADGQLLAAYRHDETFLVPG